MEKHRIGFIEKYGDKSYVLRLNRLNPYPILEIRAGDVDFVFSPTSGSRSIQDLKNAYLSDDDEWAYQLAPGWVIIALRDNI